MAVPQPARFADTNRTREGGVRHLVNESMRPRIRAPVEQEARAREGIPGRARRDARIAEIKQRIPAARSAPPPGRVRIAVEVFPQCTDVADGRCHVRVVPREPGRCLQDRLCLFSPPDGVVPSVRKADEI